MKDRLLADYSQPHPREDIFEKNAQTINQKVNLPVKNPKQKIRFLIEAEPF